ncbi:MAG: hypothetical protein K6A93_01400 [Bacteroidaceae bacterium]|jgi:hypothetical protein|nr:hypothetical protein [Bacteroidaceae bacterium]MBR6974057.1 hypothetical protein [Bacteroidaceae bacterium]MCR5042789.1 hypothetical protein [Bacteroidaceae bacterium]
MKKIFFVCFVAASMVMISCADSKKTEDASAEENTEAAEATGNYDPEEAAAAMAAVYDGVAESIAAAESKEELVAICQEFGEGVDNLDKTYPGFTPDAETIQAYGEAGIEIGKAIGTKGLELGMTPEEIAECSSYITGE